MSKKNLIEYFWIAFGAFVIAFGVIVFYSPHELVTGGVSGLAIIIEHVSYNNFGKGIPIWLTSMLFNIPLFAFGGFVRGKEFFKRSICGFTSMTIAFYLLERIYIPATFDIFISTVFGGIIVGIGVGLLFKNSGASGGTDLAAAIVHKIFKDIPVGNILLIMDSTIIVLGVFVFGIEKGLYALISVFTVTKTISFVIEGAAFAKGIHIISDKSEEIADVLMKDLVRGVTGFYGKGMYTKLDKTILYCVVSPKQVVKLKKIVEKVDENAFIIVTDAKEVQGMGFSKE